MCDTPFKTPRPHKSTKMNGVQTSDTEESICTTNSDETTSSSTSNGQISIVAEFDDLMRHFRQVKAGKATLQTAFLDLAIKVQAFYGDYLKAVEECKRLQGTLDDKVHECSDLENKLSKARKLLDLEKINTRNARKERDDLALQISHVRELLFKDKTTTNRLSEEVRHKLSFLHNNNLHEPVGLDQNGFHPQLSGIKEVNSTGSILSDFSYSRSEDDLDTSCHAGWKKHRPSTGGLVEPAIKKRRSSGNKAVEICASDTVRATTTLTVPKEGPITATSIIESIPPKSAAPEILSPKVNGTPPVNFAFGDRRNAREHTFQQKTIVMPDTCGVCDKRIRFGKTAFKCKECKAICHVECKDKLPLPCIPVINTPNQRNNMLMIGDYTPTTPPMVPALLIHCINEIELRGLNEIGIYRVPGAERDVKNLKERFLKGKGAPYLNQIDIHVICGTVKDFLRSLREPIITHNLWRDFVQAVDGKDQNESISDLITAVNKLPRPNRDTLAYMILHLQKVSEAKDCKMNISNLAKIFGPTIVGYSSDDPNPNFLLDEMLKHNSVMEHLLNIPSHFWNSFLQFEEPVNASRLQQTPSTDSLLRQTPKKAIYTSRTPNRHLLERKQKYFASPKYYRP